MAQNIEKYDLSHLKTLGSGEPINEELGNGTIKILVKKNVGLLIPGGKRKQEALYFSVSTHYGNEAHLLHYLFRHSTMLVDTDGKEYGNNGRKFMYKILANMIKPLTESERCKQVYFSLIQGCILIGWV